MSWQAQGRQRNGWFGHGTGVGGETGDRTATLFDPANEAARFQAVAYGSMGALPVTDRRHPAAGLGAGTGFGSVMSALAAGHPRDLRRLQDVLGADAFDRPKAAADLAAGAGDHHDLARASALVADAMRDVGLDRWPRVLTVAGGPAFGDREGSDGMADQAGGYLDPDPEQWVRNGGSPSVGSGECVAPVQDPRGASAPLTSDWRRGELVQGNLGLKPGTVIATFVRMPDGEYRYSGHTAIYLAQDHRGIRVIDQWNVRDASGNIKSRQAPHVRILPFNDPAHRAIDRGENYYVVR